MTENKIGPWHEIIDPIIKNLELAHKLDMDYQFNPKGAKAIAYILNYMCDLIDNEIERRKDNQT